MAPTFPLLVLFRALGGIGSALLFAALLSFLLRTIPPENSGRAMSVFYASFNLGFIAGGLLGGVIANAFELETCCTSTRGRASSPPSCSGGRSTTRRATSTRSARAVCGAPVGPAARDGPVREPRLPVDDRRALPDAGAAVRDRHLNLMLTLGGVGLGLAIATATELVTLYPAGHATDHRGRRRADPPRSRDLAAITAVFGLASTPLMFMIAMGLLGVRAATRVSPAPCSRTSRRRS